MCVDVIYLPARLIWIYFIDKERMSSGISKYNYQTKLPFLYVLQINLPPQLTRLHPQDSFEHKMKHKNRQGVD